ncbi:MAG: DUF1428 domain-containing protein [Pseudobdellovibrionaceae bacterium]
MKKYIDICIQPIPKKNVSTYRKMTQKIGKLLIKHGALASRDYVSEDENATRLSFPKKIKLKKGEVIIYAVAEFKSKAHREKVFNAMFNDPAMAKMDMAKYMDPKRSVVGGFESLLEVEA